MAPFIEQKLVETFFSAKTISNITKKKQLSLNLKNNF